MKPTPRHTRGFAIVSAIFILVVLAALGAFIVSVSTSQQTGAALDIQGVRAYQAAKAGVEWGVHQVQATPAYNFSYGTPAVAVGSANANTRLCPASPASFVPAAPTLAAFTVTVTCAATVDANNGPTVFRLISTACNQPAAGVCPNAAPAAGFDYIERRIEVLL
ncbi:MAG: agglutinin biogenesis protein MshP [Betaproteobacteria bacterium HGW-Betaproteobacteria-11]|nr:MAG: agglutinin biogenesis protein MshP [Betaproteobacteria bacterium HGW-Betaproteobacteria-11]